MDPVAGDKLWRPEDADPDFGKPNDRGQVTVRAQFSEDKWYAVPNGNPGMVGFCPAPVPPDWKFMLVVHATPKTLFVEPR